MTKKKIKISEYNKIIDEINKREPSREEIKELFEVLEEEENFQEDEKKIAKDSGENGVEQTWI